MSNLDEQWRYTYYTHEGTFTLHTVSVDADDEGRARDYGHEILRGECEDPEILWAITATPVLLNALQTIRRAMSPGLYQHFPETARLLHGICNRAIQEATSDPNAQ